MTATQENRKGRLFFGVRHPLAQLLFGWFLIVVLVGGGFLCIDRYVLKPRRDRDLIKGTAAAKQHARWQKQGLPGWEHLFDEAASSLPGYTVDVGRPARLKLAELGPSIVPFLEEKLESPVFEKRITAIQVLGAVGQSSEQITNLLQGEFDRATSRRERLAVLHCASTWPEKTPLAEISFTALDVECPKTRRLAVDSLVTLHRTGEGPADLNERLAALFTSDDVALRIELAVQLIDEDRRRAYAVLLEGLDDVNPETVALAVEHTERLRRHEPVKSEPPPIEEEDEIKEAESHNLASYRAWLQEQLDHLETE